MKYFQTMKMINGELDAEECDATKAKLITNAGYKKIEEFKVCFSIATDLHLLL